jgi:beta-galactosidase GanA
MKRILFAAIIIILWSNLVFSQEEHWIGDKKLYYGVAYYPETWDEKEIERDIKLMKEVNINVVRMAEFSWSKMEPEEGRYEFEWLHSVIDNLHKNGIDVVLGTPTATPPAWMAEKYPEIFTLNEDGIRRQHGGRRNCSYTSPVYREKSRIIIEKMSEEFGIKPGVIGWQTDNEFHLSKDYSQITRDLFHKWLEKKYGNIDNLNHIWATDLWSQTYNNFSQIPLPRGFESHHTSLRYEWQRFSSEMVDQYQDIHIQAIRKYSDLPITHDGMPGQSLDYVKLFDDLDFMAVNNYHSFEAYNRIQSNYDRMRGYKKGYHWLFETAPNNSGGGDNGNTWFLHQPEGSLFAAIWMNYAMGGQGTMFWLWRQHRADREMPHGSFINTWGKKAANWIELVDLGNQIANQSEYLMENPVAKAEIAIIYSHQNDAGFRIEEYANGLKYYNDWTYRFYRPVSDAFLHRDVIHEYSNLESYKLLLLPLMPYIPEETRQRIMMWVEEGGTLLLGPMSGYRTEEWAGFADYATGSWEEWMDIEVESRIPVGTQLRPAEIPLMLEYNSDLNMDPSEAGLWAESLSTRNGKIIAEYKNGMQAGRPAIIESSVGKGKVVFLGCDPGYERYKELVLIYSGEAGIKPLATGDKDVLVMPRKSPDSEALFIINLANENKKINVPGIVGRDLFSGRLIREEDFSLSPYECLLIEKENN